MLTIIALFVTILDFTNVNADVPALSWKWRAVDLL